MMYEHILGGCTPTPLSNYLKALGILRLVAEQKDTQAAGRWRGEQFVLRSNINRKELEQFFLEEYCPTPIIAPWNGGSGFYPNDNKSGIAPIAAATSERLKIYKDVILSARACIAGYGLEESPKEDDKKKFLSTIRAIFPDSALQWFDAAVMLGANKPDYPPLLGTGGNDGRLDFTNNFMQRIITLFNPADGKSTAESPVWLKGSLSGDAAHGLVSKAIGQFAPGSAGGPNSSSGSNVGAVMNPWDFVLMLEGALVFAGAATRRLESSENSVLSYPFTVRTTGSGTGCGVVSDESQSRAEIWLPLWHSAASLPELRMLLAEGRVSLGRRPARDGLEFARAVSNLGVERGIMDFQRYAFMMRSGKAYLATPLARVKVFRNPQVDILTHLDRNNWLDRLRRLGRGKNIPGRIPQLVRRLEDEIFVLIQSGGAMILQRILILLGQIQQVCANSAKAREEVTPIPSLGTDWAFESDDGSHEYRLACAVAGLTSMRNYLFPLKENGSRYEWLSGSSQAVWAGGDLVKNLLRVLDRRLIEAQRNQEDEPLDGYPTADLSAVMAFLRRETDDTRINKLIAGLVNVDLPQRFPEREGISETPTAAFCVMKPLFTPDKVLKKISLLPPTSRLKLPREIVILLKTGNRNQADRAMDIAWRRLKIADLKLPTYPKQPPALVGFESTRLAAALMIPLSMSDLVSICKPLTPDKESS